MRGVWLISVAALGLAACSSEPDEAQNALPANEMVAEIPTAEPLPAIPERFQGTYDRNAVACGADTGEMRLVVEPQRMQFYESVGRVTRVMPRDDGAIDVDVVSTGEGVTEQRQYRLSMAEGGRLTVVASGAESTRVRCNAPEAATAEAGAKVPIALAPDGLQLVDPQSGRTRMVSFGTPRSETLALVKAGLGDPSATTSCEVAPLALADFGDAMTLSFEDGNFVGWNVNPRAGRTLSTMTGVAIGSTRAELEDSLAAEISQTSLGTEFNAGGLSGVLSGGGGDARIEALWAGMTCIAR